MATRPPVVDDWQAVDDWQDTPNVSPGKQPGPRDPAFYGDPNDPQSMMEAGRFSGTADAAGPSVGILASAAGAGLVGGSRLGLGAVGAAEEGFRDPSPKNILRGGVFGAFAPDILTHALGPVLRSALGGRGGRMTSAALEALASKVKAASTSSRVGREVLPEGQRAMATNLGGIAKAGPPPTSPDQLEAALRNSIKANEVKSGLAAERLRVGAERAGGRKGPLMTALARDEAGPVLGEMRGTASPVLPEKAIADIAAALRKLPRGGPERLAYVERATSGKAKATGETIRRALESMGLLVPLGVAGSMGGE